MWRKSWRVYCTSWELSLHIGGVKLAPFPLIHPSPQERLPSKRPALLDLETHTKIHIFHVNGNDNEMLMFTMCLLKIFLNIW